MNGLLHIILENKAGCSASWARAGFLVLLISCLAGCKVSLNVEGNGAGEIHLAPGELVCGNLDADCAGTLPIGSTALITAVPADGSVFSGWAEGCEGTDPVCELPITGPKSVSAIFERPEYVEQPADCSDAAANSLCLSPKQSADYYAEQSVKYFLTMESSVSPLVIPNYSERVVRWEWPPWLLLTGYGRFNLIWTDIVLKLNPTSYAVLNCQGFDVQPFGRCHVVFDYSGELCPIYEEFTFNDQGEITFIEAWTDMPGWIPMAPEDYWAEGNIPGRLSTRVPGLGNQTGLVDWDSDAVQQAAAGDADLAELVHRVNDPYRTWAKELVENTQALAEGCDPDHVGFELD